MNPLTQLAALVAVSASAAGITWLVKGPPEKVPLEQCDPLQLKEDELCLSQVSGNVLWVDARPRAEWEKRSVEGAILWNLDPKENQQTFEAEAAMKVLEAELVVVYCGSEACGTSREVADRIRALQMGPPVKVLHGGWDAIKDSNSGP